MELTSKVAIVYGAHVKMEDPEFLRAFEVHRRSITSYCYRMLGSLQDAEEVAQDTLLRAWQKPSVETDDRSRRAWLFAIATRRCLDALRKKRRRRASVKDAGGLETAGVYWIEPAPDALFDATTLESPEDKAAAKQKVGLAFVIALQVLSPRQRAAVLLVDVLGWSAEESARLLEITQASVNSLLQRARKLLTETETAAAIEPDTSTHLRAFVAAWETGDIDGLAAMLADDARLVMPPAPQTYLGRDAVVQFLAPFVRVAPKQLRILPTSANGLPAIAIYKLSDDGRRFAAVGITVLSVKAGRIATITRFGIPALFPRFGLPMDLAV